MDDTNMLRTLVLSSAVVTVVKPRPEDFRSRQIYPGREETAPRSKLALCGETWTPEETVLEDSRPTADEETKPTWMPLTCFAQVTPNVLKAATPTDVAVVAPDGRR